ncbi:Stage II sporulation protein e/serine phosphatase [Heliorestis convoluta]|uniref:Stage II sporulation protein e/serine phosphatase n=2 Tax=Heliorestis convoluta TaxID=356322 RepID=A0A5Q2N5W8_9FIRM|nr:Stage II sporulation protein e/serine phosphatase [Heliorestis convoluta]
MQNVTQTMTAMITAAFVMPIKIIRKMDMAAWLWWITLFLFARGTILGGLSVAAPALIALVATRKPDRLLFAMAGMIAGWASLWITEGSIIFPDDAVIVNPLFQLLAWFTIALLGFTLQRYKDISLSHLALLVLLTLWAVGGAATIWEGPTVYGTLLVLFEGLVAGLLVIVMVKALESLEDKNAKAWSTEATASILMMVLLAALGIPTEPLYGLSLLTIFSGLIILIGAATFGVTGGTVTAVALGLLPALASFGAPTSMAMLTLSGLLAGLFRKWAKPGIIAGFFMGHFILSIYLLNGEQVAKLFLEAAIASAFFLIMPPRWLAKIHQRIRNKVEKKSEEVALSVVSKRLEEMGSIFRQLSQTLAELSQEESRPKQWTAFYETIEERVCKDCSSYGLCWERDEKRTRQHLEALLEEMEEKGEMTARELHVQCARWGELSATIRSLFETIEVDRYWRRRMEESKNLVSAQYKGLSRWMESLSREMVIEGAPEGALKKAKEVLATKGFQLKSIDEEVYPQQWILEVGGRGCSGQWSCAEVAVPTVAEVLNKPMTVNNSNCSGQKGSCAFLLSSEKPYGVEIATAQAPRFGSAVSGDSIGTWSCSTSKKIVALSDGAGIGAKAARESSATLALLEQFSKAGVEAEETVAAVNALIGLTTEDDSFATVDMAAFDLSSAELEMIKLGAAPSYLKRGRKVQFLQASSLPLGIIKSLEVEVLSTSLLPGDLLIMVSDGIADGKNKGKRQERYVEDWLYSYLIGTEEVNPQRLADAIMEEALQDHEGRAHDDCTVIVVAVRNREDS